MNIPHKILRESIVPSAHSMDASFYALCKGTLVEFWTGQNGVVPYGYPTHTEIYNNLFKIACASKDIPSIKQKMESLKAKYKQLYKRSVKGKSSFDWKNLLHGQAVDIIKDFTYTYKAENVAQGADQLLKGEIDEFHNIYRYNLITEPTISLPQKLTCNICTELPLPSYTVLEEARFFFSPASSPILRV